MVSDDEMNPCRTRNICLRDLPDTPPGTAPPDLRCSGTMHPEISEAKLYTELSYLSRLFDVDAAVKALGQNNESAKTAALTKLAPIRDALDFTAAQSTVLLNKSGYRWINLSSLFGTLGQHKKQQPIGSVH
jgi:DNA polymerase alpha subunit A